MKCTMTIKSICYHIELKESRNMKDIIVITGPTAVGKTKLSVSLAKRINAEIINADSMQVYKGLDIGTAKIKEEEKEKIKHHLFDIKNVSDMYTIYDYQKDCRAKIDEILKKGKKVIIVGGSGLYLKACLYDYVFEKENTKSFDEYTNEELYKMALDKDKNMDIHVNNRRRLVRFLNRSSTFKTSKKLYDFDIIGLTTEREVLYDKINKRVDEMINNGLVNEVRAFYGKKYKSLLTGIGYKELFPYFDKEITLEEAIENIKKNSRHYAKRQYTFFKHQFNVKWFETNYDDFSKTIDEVYNYIAR